MFYFYKNCVNRSSPGLISNSEATAHIPIKYFSYFFFGTDLCFSIIIYSILKHFCNVWEAYYDYKHRNRKVRSTRRVGNGTHKFLLSFQVYRVTDFAHF